MLDVLIASKACKQKCLRTFLLSASDIGGFFI